jgi:hypothetical protein
VAKLTEEKVKRELQKYFYSRRVVKEDREGNPLRGKNGELLYEERPCTVTGVALALGMTGREELEKVQNKKIQALIRRALLRVEESAEEKLFSDPQTANGKQRDIHQHCHSTY